METISSETKFKITITLLATVLITCIFLLITTQRINRIEIEKLKMENTKKLESMYFLYDELFNEKTDASRHELTREEFFTNHPNLKKEYVNYYEHETE